MLSALGKVNGLDMTLLVQWQQGHTREASERPRRPRTIIKNLTRSAWVWPGTVNANFSEKAQSGLSNNSMMAASLLLQEEVGGSHHISLYGRPSMWDFGP
jgi:hypothetical protein